MIPEQERDVLEMLREEVELLAAQGMVTQGFRLLLGGLLLAEEASQAQRWGPALLDLYREALARYVEQHGAVLLH